MIDDCVYSIEEKQLCLHKEFYNSFKESQESRFMPLAAKGIG